MASGSGSAARPPTPPPPQASAGGGVAVSQQPSSASTQLQRTPRATPQPTPSAASSASTAPQGPQLKYLSFVRVSVIELYLFLIQIYDHLKDKSGPFKPGIESVESTVKTVVGPVLSRVNFDPDYYLLLADSKVGGLADYVEHQKREAWRSSAVHGYLVKVFDAVRVTVDEFNHKGFAATVHTYYEFFLPTVLAYVEILWQFITALPLAPQVLAAVQPSVVYVAQHYNRTLDKAQKSDIRLVASVAAVLPTIPTDKLKKAL